MQSLDVLIAHTRTYDIFPTFSARISLHHAHLAHALGQTARALECYRVAAHVAEEGSFVCVAARAGEVSIKIGSIAQEGVEMGLNEEMILTGGEVARSCRGMGSTLEAVGRIIESSLTKEIIKAK
jgi:hypothetical protein